MESFRADSRVDRPQSWIADAACKGLTSLFFAPEAERALARERREALAHIVCNSCSVLYECREYARENYEFGIWGGETEEERRDAGFRAPGKANPSEVRARNQQKYIETKVQISTSSSENKPVNKKRPT